MGTEKVLVTDKAKSDARRLQTIIDGNLQESIRDLLKTGDDMSQPNVWDGKHAETFRTDWAAARPKLNQMVKDLDQVRTAVQKVHTNIFTAGGNPG